LKSGIGPQSEIGNLPGRRKAKSGGSRRIGRDHFSRMSMEKLKL